MGRMVKRRKEEGKKKRKTDKDGMKIATKKERGREREMERMA